MAPSRHEDEGGQLQLVDADRVEGDEEECFESIDKLISQGINAGDVKKLQDAGIYTCNGLMMHTKKNLTGIKGLSEAKVDKICEAAEKLLNQGFMTGNDLLLKRKSVVRITTGSQALDELLGGGIATLCITEAFGEFWSGKTQLAHTLCVSTQLPIHMHEGNGKVAYIGTEGTFQPERIVPIAVRFGINANAVLNNIIYACAYTYEHQYNLLLDLAAKMAEEPFRLLIVDSVFRVDFSGRGELAERQQKLAEILSHLTKIAEEFNVAVYVTNQVIADPGDSMFITDPKKPAGGHAATIKLMLRKGKGEQGFCKIFDAPNLPEGEAVFQVTSGGIRDVEPSRHADEGRQLQLIDADRVEDEEECFESIDQLISQGINAGDVKKLQDAGIYTCNDLMKHTKKNLIGITGLSDAKADKICEAAEKLLNKGFMTGIDLLFKKSHVQSTIVSQARLAAAMTKNKDSKFANQYQIPVEVLQEGLPALLLNAPDDELQSGNLIRIATANGLNTALALQAPGTVPLQAYIVHYISPKEAQLIAKMVEKAKSKYQAAGGAIFVSLSAPQAGSANAARLPFNIANESALEAKVLALMAIRAELDNIIITANQVREKKEAPYYSETPFVDHGLPAAEHLKPLKLTYFANHALSGHYNIAKSILKCIDRPMFRSLLKSFQMTEIEEEKNLLDLAVEYQERYPQYKSLSLAKISQQLLGLLGFLDLHDKKRLLTPTDLAAVSSDRSRLLKLLKRQKQKFRDLMDKQSLIGAESVNFQML